MMEKLGEWDFKEEIVKVFWFFDVDGIVSILNDWSIFLVDLKFSLVVYLFELELLFVSFMLNLNNLSRINRLFDGFRLFWKMFCKCKIVWEEIFEYLIMNYILGIGYY